ncbi:MAG TPA: LamG domain-containing protein [Thermoanaerobaculia bacterium]|nr:LamG domain-containing protein [Thermoanaerobaculia bacterium]
MLGLLVLGIVLAAALPGAAGAQPFDSWLDFTGNSNHGYVRVPHSAALNPTGALTFEAWVFLSAIGGEGDCRSIAGKNYLQSYWFGVCVISGEPTLRSYLKGGASRRNGGVVPTGAWTHIAVVFNGTRRLHYINGEVAGDFPETGPLTTSTDEFRIASDVQWQFTPQGDIDEVRFWNVGRSTAQIRSTINQRITTAQPGLVAVWPLNGNGNEIIGGRNGSIQGAGVFPQTFAAIFSCGFSNATTLCLQDRFAIRAFWRTSPAGNPPDGSAMTVPVTNPGSGLFWFFSANNWEIMVKAINGCGLNDRHWIFSAATTNVFYRMEVLDVRGAEQKIYFNYPGPPAPAVTDTDAFATCP